jgi:hypothetical protein
LLGGVPRHPRHIWLGFPEETRTTAPPGTSLLPSCGWRSGTTPHSCTWTAPCCPPQWYLSRRFTCKPYMSTSTPPVHAELLKLVREHHPCPYPRRAAVTETPAGCQRRLQRGQCWSPVHPQGITARLHGLLGCYSRASQELLPVLWTASAPHHHSSVQMCAHATQ